MKVIKKEVPASISETQASEVIIVHEFTNERYHVALAIKLEQY